MKLWLARFILMSVGILLALLPVEWYMRQTVRFSPPLTECDPHTGYRLITNRHITDHNPGEFRVRYNVNALGLRGEDISQAKTPGTQRILGLGDSFTFGVGVEDDETYLAVLDQQLPATVEVLNAGVSGWGNSNELIYLQEKGLALEPDVIVVGFYVGNDAGENLANQIFRLDENGNLERTPTAERPEICLTRTSLITKLPFYGTLADHSATLAWLRAQYAAQSAEGGNVAPSSDPVGAQHVAPAADNTYFLLTQKIWAEINAVGQARGIPVIFVMIPIRWTPDTDEATVRGYLAPWLELCAAENLTCLDTTPALLESGLTVQELYYQVDNHWRPAAHRLVGDMLAQYIQALLPQ